jgi:hypothetical protein
MTNTSLDLENLKYFDVEEHPSPFYKGYYRVTGKSDAGESVIENELIFKLDINEFKKSMMEIGHSEESLTDFPNPTAFRKILREHRTEILSKIFEVSGKPTDYREISKILDRNDYVMYADMNGYDLI